MKPVQNQFTNRTLGKPETWDETTNGPCVALYVHRSDEDNTYYSWWKPTWRERLSLILGKPVRLALFGEGHPPVALEVTNG